MFEKACEKAGPNWLKFVKKKTTVTRWVTMENNINMDNAGHSI